MVKNLYMSEKSGIFACKIYICMANDKMIRVLEYSVLYPGEQQQDVDGVISSMSRNTIINMDIVLTNLYGNKGLENIPKFFSNERELIEVIQRIKLHCDPNVDYVILPLQTTLRMMQMAFAMPATQEDQLSDDFELQLFKVILTINEQEVQSYRLPENVAGTVFIQSLITYPSCFTLETYKERTFYQSYSALQFFRFIESKIATDSALRTIYDAFLEQYGVENGVDYIRTMTGVVTITKWVVGKMPGDFSNDVDNILRRQLIESLTIDLNTQFVNQTGRNNNVDYRKFRDKPFIRDEAGNIAVVWIEALLDRLYNSLYFDFGEINRRLNTGYAVPQLFTNEFAEKYMFQKLMRYANGQTMYNALYNPQEQENGKADYVLVKENVVIVFECKDIKILGDVIETHDGVEILEEYRNKLYYETYDTRRGERRYHVATPKGVGQLINYMNQIRTGDPYYVGTQEDSVIYPVLVLSDYKLLQRGFQQIADEWYEERENKSENDKPLTVMSFITLMKSYPLFATNGFEHYFDKYRECIVSNRNPANLDRYMTFDEYMQDFGEQIDIKELRNEFIEAISIKGR